MMKTLALSFLAFAVSAFTSIAHATTTFDKTTVTLDTQAKIFAEIHRGQPDKATFVLLNGLSYDMNRWNALTDQLAAQGFTIVRYAYEAQPESLRLYGNTTPPFLTKGLELKDLANELSAVLNVFHVTNKIQLVGLSYGASVATEFAMAYPAKIASLILVSPLVVPLESYVPEGQSLRAWLDGVRFWEDGPCELYGAINPWLCLARDYWYDAFYSYFYQNYLQERLQAMPEGVDPTIYKKAIFHLVRATRNFDLRNRAEHLPNMHLLIASEDDPNLVRDQKAVWDQLVPEQRRSFVIFEGAHHALPDEAPVRTGQVLTAIANQQPETQAGRTWTVRADR